ncbi:MAG: hypothetical protein ACK4VZ_10340 [Paracoccaceae bacterium]
MVRSLIFRLRGLALVMLLAVALGTVGFGHRTPSQQDATVDAFLLSGFAMADLCGSSGSDGSATGIPCPACTLAATALMPAGPCIVHNAGLKRVATIVAPRAPDWVPTVHDPAHAPRAPPFGLVLSV